MLYLSMNCGNTYYVNKIFAISKASSGCSLVVRIPRCGRGDLGSNPSSHNLRFCVLGVSFWANDGKQDK